MLQFDQFYAHEAAIESFFKSNIHVGVGVSKINGLLFPGVPYFAMGSVILPIDKQHNSNPSPTLQLPFSQFSQMASENSTLQRDWIEVLTHETSTFVPSAISTPTPRIPEPAPALPPSTTLPPFEDFAPKGMADLQRRADDIIANFRARNQTGIDRALDRWL